MVKSTADLHCPKLTVKPHRAWRVCCNFACILLSPFSTSICKCYNTELSHYSSSKYNFKSLLWKNKRKMLKGTSRKNLQLLEVIDQESTCKEAILKRYSTIHLFANIAKSIKRDLVMNKTY